MKIVVRPIRYTSRMAPMREWATRLGLVVIQETDAWIVLQAGAGRLALHQVSEGDPLAGCTTLAVETDDFAALEKVWADAGMQTRLQEHDSVPLLFGTTPFGGEIVAGKLSEPLDGAAGPQVAQPDLLVMPMLVASDVPAAAEWFVRWGLPPRVTSDDGGWADFEIPDGGGLLAIHAAGGLSEAPPPQPPSGKGLPEIGVGLTFEISDVDRLGNRLRDNGLEDAHVVDEAYNRTLLLGCPDGDTIWVGETQRDLYGYSRS